MNRTRMLLVLGMLTLGAGATWWWVRGGTAVGPQAAPGTLAVQWQGKHRGSTVLPARINWCPVTRTGVLEAIAGDTGIAVVLYEVNALSRGPHAVVAPGGGAAVPRPGASVVMRWPKDSTVLLAFTSHAGLIDVRTAPTRLSGTLSIRLRASSGVDTLSLQGSFTDVPVVSMAVGCP